MEIFKRNKIKKTNFKYPQLDKLDKLEEREKILEEARKSGKTENEIELEKVNMDIKELLEKKIIGDFAARNLISLLRGRTKLEFKIEYDKWFRDNEDVIKLLCANIKANIINGNVKIFIKVKEHKALFEGVEADVNMILTFLENYKYEVSIVKEDGEITGINIDLSDKPMF